MPRDWIERFREALGTRKPEDPDYAVCFIEAMLTVGRSAGASDLHLQPTASGVEMRWRIDGVLQAVGVWPKQLGPNFVARLKVLADLLTYRTDVPQEGRIRDAPGGVEMRVSTFPTLYGERAAVRLFAPTNKLERLADLGFPSEIARQLSAVLHETSGAIFIAGPAGSGKTTTLYACLRELAERANGGRNLVSLEDPIEAPASGVAQSQIHPAAGFTFAVGLRSLMRQDPEVIMIGEIRDRETADAAFQAALTGHLVLTSFHAGSAAGVISRLSDLGIEPYLLRSGVLAIVCQRLVRVLCGCARAATDEADKLGLPVARSFVPTGCDQCARTGYRGRTLLAEMLIPDRGELGRAILCRDDARQLEQRAIDGGMVTCWQRALEAVAAGRTSPAEVRRVLGFRQAD